MTKEQILKEKFIKANPDSATARAEQRYLDGRKKALAEVRKIIMFHVSCKYKVKHDCIENIIKDLSRLESK